MLRTLFWFICFWLSLIFYLPMMLKAKRLETPREKRVFADKKARAWARFLLRRAGAEVTVEGLDKIPTEGSVVYIANHQSNFDVPLMIAHMPKSKGFIAKAETLKIPIVRTWMTYMNCVFLDRSDIRQQVKAIGEGVRNIKDGQSMVIFPEGTRSIDGQLSAFKAGSLKLATKSGATIVPVAIENSMGLMKKGDVRIRKAQVTLKVCEPIVDVASMNRETNVLAEEVKTRIQAALGHNS